MSKSQQYNWRALSQQTLLNILNSTAHTINKWISNGCPCEIKNGKKYYDTGKVLEWRVEYQKKLDKHVPDDPDLDGASGPLKDELLKVKIEKERFDLGVKRSQYISNEKYEQDFREVGDYVRRSLQNLPKKISTKLNRAKNASEIENILKTEIHSLLKQMSK